MSRDPWKRPKTRVKLWARAMHRLHRTDRAVEFLELGIYRGDLLYVTASDVCVWSEVKDFKVDKFRRRWVILKNGTEVRVDPAFQGSPLFWENTSETERMKRGFSGE